MSVFNGAPYLRRSLESILGQAGVDFEFMVVDDGSTDSSAAILAEYAARDRRLRVLTQPNAGLTRALIRGCEEARAPFIARQDADDFSFPGRLLALVEMLRGNPRLVFVSSWAITYSEQGEVLDEFRRPFDSATATELLLNHELGPPGHGSVMFRGSAYQQVGGYHEQFYCAQDRDLWLRLGEIGELGYCQRFLYAYSFSESAISSRYLGLQKRLGALTLACYQARLAGRDEGPFLADAAKVRPTPTRPKSDEISAGLYFIGSALRQRRDPRARNYYLRVIRCQPLRVAAWIGLFHSLAHGRWSRALNVGVGGVTSASGAAQALP